MKKPKRKTRRQSKPIIAAPVSALPENRYGIYINGGGKPEIAEVILQILATPHADEATKVAALQTLEKAVSGPISISGVNIQA